MAQGALSARCQRLTAGSCGTQCEREDGHAGLHIAHCTDEHGGKYIDEWGDLTADDIKLMEHVRESLKKK